MLLRLILLYTCAFSYNLAVEVSVPKKWICNEHSRCVPYTGSRTFAEFEIYDTQNICRLSCGRYGSLWPRPTGASIISHSRVYLSPKNIRFDFTYVPQDAKDFMEQASSIFLSNVWNECKKDCSSSGVTQLLIKIVVSTSNLSLNWDTDETYVLVISSSGSDTFAEIQAQSVYGARHALESISQLVTASADNSQSCTPSPIAVPPKEHTLISIDPNIDILIRGFREGRPSSKKRKCPRSGLIMVSSARIVDKPVYKHRGLLLDTARNFIPLKNIERTLDAMATSKMNVFHWHATDSQSFPIEITRVPQLQRFGAYSQEETYTRADMDHIIKYAKMRGIRVLVEFDSPSHAGNGWQWGPLAALGDLAVCINQQPWRNYCIQPPCGQLNPVNENLYSVLKLVFEDIAEVTLPEETIHLGGDEVFLNCWNSSSEIVNKLQERGLDTSVSSFLLLWAEFHQRTLALWNEVKGKETQAILWSSHLTEPDIIEKYLSPEKFIIQTWVPSSQPLVDQLLSKGYKVIASTKDAWYLDHGFWGVTSYYDWKRVYDNRLSRNANLLGGEVCMWSEYVDENSLDSRVWPRAGAAAERLWSDPDTNGLTAESRFLRYRERLISRGIAPDAIVPGWCAIHEGQCL